jgi:hypothetical protein
MSRANGAVIGLSMGAIIFLLLVITPFVRAQPRPVG